MVDHPTTGGCKAASIIRNKRATDFLNVSVGEATDARHASVSDCLVEWYCHQPCTNSPNWMYYCCVIPHGRLVASPTVAGYYLAPLNSTLLSQADMHIILYLISYISYLISYISVNSNFPIFCRKRRVGHIIMYILPAAAPPIHDNPPGFESGGSIQFFLQTILSTTPV